jgi:hypothetical protein
VFIYEPHLRGNWQDIALPRRCQQPTSTLT